MDDKKRMRAEALRYKRSALGTMGYHVIEAELEEIVNRCEDIRWAEDSITQTVLDDYDDDAGYKMDFSDLAAEAEQLAGQLWEVDAETFDDCTVSLIGNRFDLVGYDTLETDFFSLCRFDADRAVTASGQRLMRRTKSDMLAAIAQSVGIMMAFYDLRQRYDYMAAALNVALDHNLDTLHTVRGIENAYTAWCDDGCRLYSRAADALDRACSALDDIYWIA